jgi:hypothetical protein
MKTIELLNEARNKFLYVTPRDDEDEYNFSDGLNLLDKAITELKNLEDIKLISIQLCDILEYEWAQGDGMPENAVEAYTRACKALGRTPKFESGGEIK